MTPAPPDDPIAVREASPDGVGVDAQRATPHQAAREVANWRQLLGWSPTSAPVALLLLVGVAIGPRGVNLLTAETISLLNIVVPVALGALGVLVGLSVGGPGQDDRRLLAAACLGAALTMLVVSAGIAAVAFAAAPVVFPRWTLIVVGGICAASSLTLPTGNPLEPRTATIKITELAVLVPIAAGGLALAWLRAGSFAGSLLLAAEVAGITIAVAAAASLLLTTQAPSHMEERVLAISALLLVGGVAGALALSALFAGLVAGVFWRYGPRHPRDTIARHVLFVQHPLLVLVLLVAGARADVSVLSLSFGAAYLGLRVAGQLAGGILASRVAGPNVPRDLGFHLLPPGVFGVAVVLNAPGNGSDTTLLLSTVVVGTIGSEFVARLLPPRGVDQ